MALSPDGKQVAFIASVEQPVNSYTQPDLVGARSGRRTRSRGISPPNFDWDVGSSVFGDNGAPRGGGGNVPIWTADGKGHRREFREGRANESRARLMSRPVR